MFTNRKRNLMYVRLGPQVFFLKKKTPCDLRHDGLSESILEIGEIDTTRSVEIPLVGMLMMVGMGVGLEQLFDFDRGTIAR